MRSLFTLFIVCCLAGVGHAAPSFTEINEAYHASDAVLLDRSGEVIHELRVDPDGRRLAWTTLDDVSPAFVRAVIRSEDRRFFVHHGVDWRALLRAAVGDLFGGRRGASTITMQLTSLINGGLKSRGTRRSLRQKWGQIRAARDLERSWTKNEILEAYLNLVSFRGELRGIRAASRGLFDKEPGGLDDAEAAILAALIRSPNAESSKVAERATLLVRSLHESVPDGRIRQLAAERLTGSYAVRRRVDDAPFVARMLLRKGVQRTASTLDGRIQRFVAAVLRQAVGELSGRNVRDGAVLVADNASGDVLAYVGNSGALSSAPAVDGIRAGRQAGSTLKPFLYGYAIEQRIITAASLLEDAPLDLPTGRGVYRPQNYDREFRGTVSSRTALASSLNIPAVKLLTLVGADPFAAELRKFGFRELREGRYYGPSLALGSADVSLWELVNAYRALANRGVWSGLRLSPSARTAKQRRVMSPEAAFVIADILSDREARSATFSLENTLATRYWSAVKTGTSKDMRDNWCVGFTDRYTVGVWIGNFSGASMWNVSGVSGAAPVWMEVMNELHRTVPARRIQPAAGVAERDIKIEESGRISVRREWFLKGTAPETAVAAAADEPMRIIYPAQDTVIAVDPDIPEDRQKVYFEATAPGSWSIDGTLLGNNRSAAWTPVRGKHRVSLLDRDGTVIDTVSFQVR